MNAKTAWKCDVCGYIHEGFAPPDECPVCGVGPDLFNPLETPATKPASQITSRWRCMICDYVHQGAEPPDVCPVCGAGREHFEALQDREQQSAQSEVGTIVIVGAGIAGLTAADKARVTCGNCRIIVVNKETVLPYYRLNLTRLLAGEVNEEQLILQRKSWFEEHGIELVEAEVVSIDPTARSLDLDTGQSLDYEALILANGSHAFVPPFTGVRRAGVHVFRTLEDGRTILGEANPGSNCVCIGGGLLGLETAGALRKKGLNVAVVEGFGWLLPRQLPEIAGTMLARYIESLGIAVHTDAAVKELTGDESVRGVMLEDGRELPADLVVISTGVRSNSHLARRGELTVANGVIVDDQMQTSHPGIYAAGDVAEHRGKSFGIWPVSYAQGVVAGINAAGGEAEYRPMPPSNRLKVMDVDVFSIGEFTSRDASYQVYDEQDEKTFTRLVVRDGRLVGAVLYGDTVVAGVVKDAIEQGKQLREVSGLLDHLPGFARFLGVNENP